MKKKSVCRVTNITILEEEKIITPDGQKIIAEVEVMILDTFIVKNIKVTENDRIILPLFFKIQSPDIEKGLSEFVIDEVKEKMEKKIVNKPK